MKYHFLEGVKTNSGRGKKLLYILPALLLLTGGYVTVNAASPMLATVPGVAIGETTEDKLKDEPGAHGNRLFLPQIDVNVAIMQSEDGVGTEGGAWHQFASSGDPQRGGTFVLTAQKFELGVTPTETKTQSPFYNLDRLETGHQLFVDFGGNRYGYEVISKNQKSINEQLPEGDDADAAEAQMILYARDGDGTATGSTIIAKPLGEVQQLQER